MGITARDGSFPTLVRPEKTLFWTKMIDSLSNIAYWVVGTGGDQRLHGYNGDTGAVVYAGGGTNELMTGTRQ